MTELDAARERLPLVYPALPRKDCAACQYRDEQWRDGGFCYMFRDEPQSEFCGSFKAALDIKTQERT